MNEPLSPAAKLIPLIVATALFMENMDSTVIVTALPAIASSMGEHPLRLSAAITAYLLSLAVFIPLSGWVADRYGTRKVFRGAILLFTFGSILCGCSQSPAEMVAARLLQGVGGAMMVPVGRLVLLRKVPQNELVRAMSYLTLPALIAPIIGPPLGGFIATYASWRWIFFINVPIGLIGYVLVTKYIGDIRAEQMPPLDFPGWLLLGVGLACLVMGFEYLGKNILPWPILLAILGLGGVLLVIYASYSRRRRDPIIDLSLLRIPSFGGSTYGGSLFRIGVGAATLLTPLMLQLGFGMSPLASGLISFSGAVGAMPMKFFGPWILRRFGFRRVLIADTLICIVLTAGFGAVRAETPVLIMVLVLFFSGVFRSLQFTCFNVLSFVDVEARQMSQATSLSGTAQQLAMSVGVGLGSQLLLLSQNLRNGSRLIPQDFGLAFVAIAAVTALALRFFLPLRRDVGDSASGYREKIAV